jgi:hypothetical protein
MRSLVAAIGIVGLIVGGHAIQAHLRSNRVAQAETKRGMSVYELHANKRDDPPGAGGTSSVTGAIFARC